MKKTLSHSSPLPFFAEPRPAPATSTTIIPPRPRSGQHRRHETAVLAGCCFFCHQRVFEHVKGVNPKWLRVNICWPAIPAAPGRTAIYQMVRHRNHLPCLVAGPLRPKVDLLRQLLQIYFRGAHDPTERRPGHRQRPHLPLRGFPPSACSGKDLPRLYIAQLDFRRMLSSGPPHRHQVDRARLLERGAITRNILSLTPDQPYSAIKRRPGSPPQESGRHITQYRPSRSTGAR